MGYVPGSMFQVPGSMLPARQSVLCDSSGVNHHNWHHFTIMWSRWDQWFCWSVEALKCLVLPDTKCQSHRESHSERWSNPLHVVKYLQHLRLFQPIKPIKLLQPIQPIQPLHLYNTPQPRWLPTVVELRFATVQGGNSTAFTAFTAFIASIKHPPLYLLK